MGNIVSKVLGIDANAASQPIRDFQPTNFSAGGLTTSLTDGVVNVASSPERSGLIQDISNGYRTLSGNLSSLIPQVSPGVGRLSEAVRAGTQAERERLASSRQRVVGNLRENLAKRRIAGSSFAVDSLARAEAEFAREERELGIREQERLAGSFLQELDMKTQLIQQESQANIASYTTMLDQMNLETQVGAQLASGATAAFNANAQLQANLLAEAQGTVAEVLGMGIGTAAGIAL